MENRKDVTVPMPETWTTAIEQELSYGDSRAGWIREAVRQRLVREGIDIEDIDGSTTTA